MTTTPTPADPEHSLLVTLWKSFMAVMRRHPPEKVKAAAVEALKRESPVCSACGGRGTIKRFPSMPLNSEWLCEQCDEREDET